MASKKEMKFLTGLKKDFKRENHYFYKIPDSPSAISFMIARPFDCFIGVNGGLGGMEAKFLDTAKDKSVTMKQLRENQHEGLKDVIARGGQGWVFYQIKFGRELRLYFWEYRDFVRLCDLHGNRRTKKIPLSVLETMDYTIGVKNRFDVLEYNLERFVEAWEMIGEIYGK